MDIEHIRGLVELMVESDLSRIEIHEGQTHILLKRGGAIVGASTVSISPAPAAIAAPAPVPAASAAAAPPAAQPATADAGETMIRSPMVGTFYTAPDPESPPFVKVGDNVGPDTVVCLIEAMKVFNEIKAECAGRIVRSLVNNGQAVEFDQPLFVVAKA